MLRTIRLILTLALVAAPARAWENRQYFMLAGSAAQAALLGVLIVSSIRGPAKKPAPPPAEPDPAAPTMQRPSPTLRDMSQDAR